jgi:hypothetical protein
VVVLESGAPQSLARSAALCALLLATAVAWFLLARAGPARKGVAVSDRTPAE